VEEEGRGGKLETKENKLVTGAIRKLDKDTLNLYNAFQTGLGADCLSWTRSSHEKSRTNRKV
jgi:hypothetical protein